MDPIVVSGRVVIPASALTFRAVRASGPGGQNVNKVSSKVELRVESLAGNGVEQKVLFPEAGNKALGAGNV